MSEVGKVRSGVLGNPIGALGASKGLDSFNPRGSL